MRKVEIEFISEQQYHDDRESSKLKAMGQFEIVDGIKTITYPEPESEMGESKTVIRVINDMSNHAVPLEKLSLILHR